MDKQRIFRVLVCFVLICALVVNISPIRAKAVDPVTLTGAAMIGLAACLAAGVVILPQTIELANQFGASFEQQIKDITIVNVDKDTLWDYYIRMRNKLDNRFSPEWDPGEFHDDLEHALANGLLSVIVSMLALTFFGDGMHIDGEIAPDGYTFYGEHCLVTAPAPSDTLPYTCLCYSPGDVNFEYWLFCGTAPFDIRFLDNKNYWLNSNSDPFVVYVLDDAVDLQWFKATNDDSFIYIGSYQVVWANHDIVDDPNSEIIRVEGSPATNAQKEIVVPEIYVGDIPQKIEDGERDPEKLGLPFIDPSKIFTNGDAQLDDYTSLVQKFKNGELTYDEFKEQYEYKKNTTTDPSTPSEPVVDPSEPSEPEDVGPIGDYALDLTEFFPFCIPYDIKEFLSLLSAAPEAPVFEWDIVVKSWDWGFHVTVDLSPWNDVAALFRKLELLAFIVGLGFVTREKFLRG